MPHVSCGRLIKDGGEGYIYESQENPDLFLKIYKETDSSGFPIVTPELDSKLSYMRDNPPENLVSKRIVAWPIKLLRNDQGKLVGFGMPRLDIDEHLQRIYSYRNLTEEPEEYAAFPSVVSRISIAINLCSALNELHMKGYVVGDFNHANIGVNYRTGQIYFVDCDSFHIINDKGDVFRTNVIMSGYLAPEIIKHCRQERAKGKPHNLDDVALPTFTKESDLFCLAVHIFKLLMNGVDPFRGIKSDATGSTASPFVGNDAIERDAYVFRSGNKPSAVFCPPASSLPPKLLSLFYKAFIDGKAEPLSRPNATNWYHALHHYLQNELAQCAKDVKHQYYRELPECPYCAADERYLAMLHGVPIAPVPPPEPEPEPEPPIVPAKRWWIIPVVAASFAVVLLIVGLLIRFNSYNTDTFAQDADPAGVAAFAQDTNPAGTAILQTQLVPEEITLDPTTIPEPTTVPTSTPSPKPTPNPTPFHRIVVPEQTIQLEPGGTYQIDAHVEPASMGQGIRYRSMHENVARVSSGGLITAIDGVAFMDRDETSIIIDDDCGASISIKVTVVNPFTWSMSDNMVKIGYWNINPMLFNQPIPNCTGFTYGYKIIQKPAHVEGRDLGPTFANVQFDIYVQNAKSRWVKVGSFITGQVDEWATTDVTFKRMTIKGVAVRATKGPTENGVLWDNTDVTNLYYSK